MMKFFLKKSLFFLFFLFVLVHCSQQPSNKTTQELSQESQTKQTKHPLWVIQTPHNKVYFLGSVHILDKETYPLPEVMENAYKESPIIVFEINLDEMVDPKFLKWSQQAGSYPEGEGLKQNINPELYKMLEQKIASLNLPMLMFEKFKPWMVAITLTFLEFGKLGFDTQHGVDQHFFNRATKDNKEKQFFETAKFQLEIFNRMRPEDQESFLKQILQDLDESKTTIKNLMENWKNGDMEKLSLFLNDSFKDYPALYHDIVVGRNQNWIPHLEKLLNQNKNVLVIVGCLHLVGKDSVLDMLKEKGYQASQH